jgi:hypothetical protein
MIPRTYAQWRHCITVECGIPLSADFIAQPAVPPLAAPAQQTG